MTGVGNHDDDMEQDNRPNSQTEMKYKSHEQDNLSRSRQLKNNSHCLKSTSSHQVPFWMTLKKLSIHKVSPIQKNPIRIEVGILTIILYPMPHAQDGFSTTITH